MMISVLVVLLGIAVVWIGGAIKEIFHCCVEEKLEPIRAEYNMRLRAKDAQIRRLEYIAAHPQVEISVLGETSHDE